MADHYYDSTGQPRHFVEKKDGSGTRPSTIADARKNGWLPSVTTITKTLAAPALTRWLVDNAVNAALTTPRLEGEDLDTFKTRILSVDAEEQAKQARDRGTLIHDALELYLGGQPDRVAPDLLPWLEPAAKYVLGLGKVIATELVLVGNGYAGKTDAIVECGSYELILDWKTTGTMPKKESWPEHQIQLAAYAAARQGISERVTRTANVYISTKEQGTFVFLENTSWYATYQDAFDPLFRVWQWMNDYSPVGLTT